MKELYKALLEVQKELKTISKDSQGQFGSYASLEKVLETVEPVLHKHGLLLLQSGAVNENENVLSTSIVHVETEQEKVSSFVLKQDKQGPQGFGAALTYCRRYAILSLVGKATGDDPDAAHIQGYSAPNQRNISQPRTQSPALHKGSDEGFAPGDELFMEQEGVDTLSKLIPILNNAGKKYQGKRYRDVPLATLQGTYRWAKDGGIKNPNAWWLEFYADVERLQAATPKPKFENDPEIPF